MGKVLCSKHKYNRIKLKKGRRTFLPLPGPHRLVYPSCLIGDLEVVSGIASNGDVAHVGHVLADVGGRQWLTVRRCRQ